MPSDPRALDWWVRQMVHTTGRWAGQPFDPRPWQRDLIGDLFQLRPDGHRRYREGLLGVARKSGKTTLTAALALGLLVCESQPGLTIVGAAAKRDQAKLMLNEARKMVKLGRIAGRPLTDFMVPRVDSIYLPELDATYKVVSADAEMEQGLNPGVVLMDELHVQPNEHLYEALLTAQGAWEDPLLLSITTAGARKKGICWDRYQVGMKGTDPELWFKWYQAPDGCDLDDRAGWAAANPGYPDVPTERFLAGQLTKISEGAFRRLHLNQWTSAIERWLPAEDWNATDGEPDIPAGSPVVVAVDAATSRDTFAVVVVRVDEHGHPHALLRVFAADATGRISHLEVLDYLLACAVRYQVRTFTGDAAYMQLLAQALLEQGLTWEPFSQGEAMLAASELLQTMVLERTLRRGDDWWWDEQMAGTAVRETDRGTRISKGASGGKNDAIVALAMGLSVALAPDDPARQHFAAWAG